MKQPTSDARAVAMRMLAMREHSASEMSRKLLQKGFFEDEVANVLSDLITEDLLSNERFTECFVNSRRTRGSGPVKIKKELQQHKIESDLIGCYLDSRDPVWTQEAARVRQKKFGPGLPEEFKDRVRQSQFLEYRGFSHEHIRVVMRDDDLVSI